MIASAVDERHARRKLMLLATLIALGVLCTYTLHFTNDGLNLAFLCGLYLLPFLAVAPILRLRRWQKIAGSLLLAPPLVLSLFALLLTVTCEVPAAVAHRSLSQELGTIQRGRYSVHLAREETAAGAVGPHGIVLEQRMTIVPGLYAFRGLDYFHGATAGSLSPEPGDNVRVHVLLENQHWEDKTYFLKRKLYF